MDHLLPFGETRTRRVPKFSTKDYEAGDFITYPAREGWIQSDISTPLQSNRSGEELNAFLQEWLYFGVLFEFFGNCLQQSDFVDARGSYISTMELRPYMAALSQRKSCFEQSVLQTYEKRIVSCLATVNYELREIAFQVPQVVDSRLLLSVAILCDFLRRMSGLDGNTLAAGHLIMREVSHSMFRAGWCPSTIKKLAGTLDPASFYLTSRFKSPVVREEKHHLKCIGRNCLASQTDEKTYTTDHVCATADCDYIKADHQELFSILRSGRIPLTTYGEDDSGGRTLKVFGWRSGVKYVAISHVWADRMGNPHDNALPRCQLGRLQHLVDELYQSSERPVPFWIDTMSCPTEPIEATDLAITYMRQTYSEADKVLVLDSFVQSAKGRGIADVETALRIVCSGWTRRLWTLQEGALAKALFVQFSDGALDLDVIHAKLKTTERWREYTLISSSLDEIRGAWQRQVDLVSSGLFVDYVSAALRYRTTSVATDEPLCLTTLSGLNMESLLALKPAERMKHFWSQLPIPAKIVFRTGETIEDAGFRWAPSSLMSSQKMRTIEERDASFSNLFGNDEPFETFLEDFEPTSFDYHQASTPLGRRGSHGLTIQRCGILLGSWTGQLGLGFFLRDESRQWFFVGCHMGQSIIGDKPPCSTTTELAILCEKSPEELFSDLGNSVDSTTVLILSISNRMDGNIDAHIERVGFLQPLRINDTISEKEGDLGLLIALVEKCGDLFRQATQEENENLGESSSRGPTSGAVATLNSRFRSLMLDSEDDEEGTNLSVSMKDGNLVILRDGEHFFFDGRRTSATQFWCID